MGFFGNLDPEAYDRQYTDMELVRRIAQYFGQHRRPLLIISGGVLLTSLLDVAFPLVLARGINALAQDPPAWLVYGLIAIVFATGVTSWGVNYLRRRLTTRVVGDVILALRRDAFRATIAHDLSFYDEYKSGRIVTTAPINKPPALMPRMASLSLDV